MPQTREGVFLEIKQSMSTLRLLERKTRDLAMPLHGGYGPCCWLTGLKTPDTSALMNDEATK
jgi:hypothetical protein